MNPTPQPTEPATNLTPCLICGKPVEHKAMYCCSGHDCGCMGMDTNPCICSQRCADALRSNGTFEQRRIQHGIERWSEPPTNAGAELSDTPTPFTDALFSSLIESGYPEPKYADEMRRVERKACAASRADHEQLHTNLSATEKALENAHAQLLASRAEVAKLKARITQLVDATAHDHRRHNEVIAAISERQARELRELKAERDAYKGALDELAKSTEAIEQNSANVMESANAQLSALTAERDNIRAELDEWRANHQY